MKNTIFKNPFAKSSRKENLKEKDKVDNIEYSETADDSSEEYLPIGREQVYKALETLRKYKNGKEFLEQRIVENEKFFKLQHWDLLRNKIDGAPQPSSAWLLNSILNKHADAMDNYPEPIVLPREPNDEESAKTLTEILPVILEQNQYEQTYSDVVWYKLKTGTGVTGVFWEPTKQNGLGDIDVRECDLLNLFWEPGIKDIQKSSNFFSVDIIDSDKAREQYPQLKEVPPTTGFTVKEYIHDENIDNSNKSVLIDWYYKVQRGTATILHYCKICDGTLLYSSENEEYKKCRQDPSYEEQGYYLHNKYPFVFDVQFKEADSPAGFGYLDICKDPQRYIDKLDSVMLENAVIGAQRRWWVKGDGIVNEEEYADLSKHFVHFYGGGNPNDSIAPIEVPTLNAIYANYRSMKIDELKETSGNTDFSQGNTAAGVTAASAIAALQEAGSKGSRAMNKSAYRSFAQICYMIIDLMRQFYTDERTFRITGDDGTSKFVQFNGAQIAAQEQPDAFGISFGKAIPIFDVRVAAQKSSPFATAAQNERAKELYSMGFFNPEFADQALAALEMMQFEGIDKVKERIQNNMTLLNQVQQLQAQVMQLSGIVDSQNGTDLSQAAAVQSAQLAQPKPSGKYTEKEDITNSLGVAIDTSSRAGEYRKRAATNASVR